MRRSNRDDFHLLSLLSVLVLLLGTVVLLEVRLLRVVLLDIRSSSPVILRRRLLHSCPLLLLFLDLLLKYRGVEGAILKGTALAYHLDLSYLLVLGLD